MPREFVNVELCDSFGTVYASGRLRVDNRVFTRAKRVDYDEDGVMRRRVLPWRKERMRDQPCWHAFVIGPDYHQDTPLNPSLPWTVRVTPQ